MSSKILKQRRIYGGSLYSSVSFCKCFTLAMIQSFKKWNKKQRKIWEIKKKWQKQKISIEGLEYFLKTEEISFQTERDHPIFCMMNFKNQQ